MRISVDADLCQGHAVCENEAPSVFSVPKGGPVTILQEVAPEALRSQVEAAVRYCPTGALTIEED